MKKPKVNVVVVTWMGVMKTDVVVADKVVMRRGAEVNGYVREDKELLAINTKAKGPVVVYRNQVRNVETASVIRNTGSDPYVEYAVADGKGFFLLPYKNEK